MILLQQCCAVFPLNTHFTYILMYKGGMNLEYVKMYNSELSHGIEFAPFCEVDQ